MIRHLLLTPLVILMAAHTAQSQSLGEVAKKEEARRKTVNTSSRVYTNQDLPEIAQPGSAPVPVVEPATSSDATAAKPEAGALTHGAERVDSAKREIDEKEWRKIAADYRQRFSTLRGDIAAVQSRLETLRADKPTPAIASEITRAEKGLSNLQYDLSLVEKDWAKIEEEARKKGASALLQE